MHFEFATAGRIVFGPGILEKALQNCCDEERVLWVCGPSRRFEQAESQAEGGAKALLRISVIGEPTLGFLEEALPAARDFAPTMVIGLGGGSAMDAGKALSALIPNSGVVLDYLEVVGRGRSLKVAPIPFAAIPTTAGTGSEVTRNAVIGVPESRAKVSLRSALMLPPLAIVDPLLSVSLPPAQTASTGLDALTQLLEPFFCSRHNPMTDALCKEGLFRVGRSLGNAWQDGQNIEARSDMALASMLSGMALANAGLGSVHGLAAAIGGMHSAPHGSICSALLLSCLEANMVKCAETGESARLKSRYETAGCLLSGKSDSGPEEFLEWIRALASGLRIQNLGQLGVEKDLFSEIARRAMGASSMKANPVPLTEIELVEILRASSN